MSGLSIEILGMITLIRSQIFARFIGSIIFRVDGNFPPTLF